MNGLKCGTAFALAASLAAGVAQPCAARDARPTDRIYETNVTRDLNMASGEPEITIDPRNPLNLAIVEFTLGSEKRPAWQYNPVAGARSEEDADESMRHLSRVMLSNDGGQTWHARPSPAYSPEHSPGGGDPMIEAGPDGTLYVANEPFPKKLGNRGNIATYTFVIAASRDWGKTFERPQFVGTPVDRPFLKVDKSTGMVYTASTGTYNPETKAISQRDVGSIADRWLVAWTPHLRSKSEPRRMGGPDFSAASGNTHIAAHGVVASTFVIGAPAPGMGPPKGPVEIPASLRPLVKDGTTSCSITAPCLFFQTSADQGRTWTRHHVPVPGGFAGFLTYVAADEGRQGRYAIGFMTPDYTGLRVVTTDDSGDTWSAPSTVVDVPLPANAAKDKANLSMIARLSASMINKPWMAYGPSGVLGFMWKQRRDDIAGPPTPPQSPIVVWGPGFDVYAAISCDGGSHWEPPLRVNAVTSPNGPSAQDDLSYIALDRQFAHLVWGDRRHIGEITNAPMGAGGLQAYYGRVPFRLAAKGSQCGRK